MTAPLITDQTLEHLDFAPACGAIRADQPGAKCPEPAVAYIELHRVGACRAQGCNAAGNMAGLICQKHVDLFTALARNILDTPIPPSLVGKAALLCATCHKTLATMSDIIVRLEML